jgi:hypothetical protein
MDSLLKARLCLPVVRDRNIVIHHGNRETLTEVSAQVAVDFSRRTGTTPAVTRFVAVKWLALAKPHAVSRAELGVVGYYRVASVFAVVNPP